MTEMNRGIEKECVREQEKNVKETHEIVWVTDIIQFSLKANHTCSFIIHGYSTNIMSQWSWNQHYGCGTFNVKCLKFLIKLSDQKSVLGGLHLFALRFCTFLQWIEWKLFLDKLIFLIFLCWFLFYVKYISIYTNFIYLSTNKIYSI